MLLRMLKLLMLLPSKEVPQLVLLCIAMLGAINAVLVSVEVLSAQCLSCRCLQGQLGVLKGATSDAQQNAAATAADLAAKQSAAGGNTAEQMLQDATNHYQSAIQEVKQQMVAERELSNKIGHTEGKIASLEVVGCQWSAASV